MGKKEITTPTRISAKKKKWHSILAPKEFGSSIIGETPAESPDKIKGRALKLDLAVLTENPRKQGSTMYFKITGLDEHGNVTTELVKYELSQMQVRRLSKRGKEKIEDSFAIECKDAKARIKPVLIGKMKLTRNKKRLIKEKVNTTIKNFCKEKTFSETAIAIINNELQKEMKTASKKVYPLSIYEIRVLEKLK